MDRIKEGYGMSGEQSTRKLTKAEEKRLERFRRQSDALAAQGYTAGDLTVDPRKANLLGTVYGLIAAVPFLLVYFLRRNGGGFTPGDVFLRRYLLFFALMIVFVAVHELLHGITWSIFAKEHFNSIEFGVLWRTLNPYCTCGEALTKSQYLMGLIMPCLILGVVPSVISWWNHSGWFLAMGMVMTVSAGGDLLIGKMILANKSDPEALYLDHPTEIGLVRFEKDNGRSIP